MTTSKVCAICNGKIGFTSSEYRRHESTKRHTDAVADFVKSLPGHPASAYTEDLPGISDLASPEEIEEAEKDEAFARAVEPLINPVSDPGDLSISEGVAKAIRSLTPGDPEYRPLADEEEKEEPMTESLSVAELKAIRMRQRWAAERADRRAAKAEEKAPGSEESKSLAALALQAWEKEQEAYRVYRAALDAGKAVKKEAVAV